MVKISVIIPTMNEASSIGQVLDEVHAAFRGSEMEHEILVVDTNSKDRTVEIARSKSAVVVPEPRRGYGRAYKTGFGHARGELIATLDADLTYPAAEIPRLARMLLEKDIEFITCDRLTNITPAAMSRQHRFGNWVLAKTANILFGAKLKDSQSGMWIFRKALLTRLTLTSDGWPLSEEIKLEACRKCRFLEVPIEYRPRHGARKLSSWRDGLRNLSFLFRKRFGHAKR